MKGRIVGLNCGMYSVLCGENMFNVPAKGVFRIKNNKPVVGDIVDIDENNIVINNIYERLSYLKRPTLANLNHMFIVESLYQPEFSFLLAFKYLTYANINGIKASIILTKADKFKDLKAIQNIKNVFNKIGIDVYVTSSKENIGLSELKPLFEKQISCFIGQSGVGKSSLLNAINPDYSRSIGEYSYALGRGKHQTKEVVLLPYLDGYIADTPGFSSLDLDIFKEDLAQYFPGFENLFVECYYSNCLHVSEDKCAVKQAVENGLIPKEAYENYLILLKDLNFKKERYSK